MNNHNQNHNHSLPLRLTNGSSRGPSVTNSERQKLAASIESTNSRAIDLDNSSSSHNGHEHDDRREYFNKTNPPKSLGLELHGKSKLSEGAESLDVGTGSGSAREIMSSPRPSRPASPYTANPPVDFDGLSWPSLGTRARLEATQEESDQRLEKLQGAVRTILECIGEDPEREGLKGTPERYAKAMLFFTKGYEENVRDLVHGAVFNEDHDELVIVRDIEVYSLCEHHMVPFTGKMHIGYIPNRRVLGLSKLARLAEMFARRLQVQERLTKQVALAIAEVLKPLGVAVVMESSHFCMVMRGVQKPGAVTTTSCMLGVLRNSAKTREEFLSLLNRR